MEIAKNHRLIRGLLQRVLFACWWKLC